MQALKHPENALSMLWRDANAIILHGEHPLRRLLYRCDTNAWHRAVTKFERIANQVLQQLLNLAGVRLHRWQCLPGHLRLCLA